MSELYREFNSISVNLTTTETTVESLQISDTTLEILDMISVTAYGNDVLWGYSTLTAPSSGHLLAENSSIEFYGADNIRGLHFASQTGSASIFISMSTQKMNFGSVICIVKPTINADPVIETQLSTTVGTWVGSPTLTHQIQTSADSINWNDVGDAWVPGVGTPYTPQPLDYNKYMRLKEIANGSTYEYAIGYSNVTELVAVPSSITYEVTTTGASQTHIIRRLGTSGTVNVNWGDGNNNDYNGVSQQYTHIYTVAGTYTVTITNPLLIIDFKMWDTKVSSITGTTISHMKNIDGVNISGSNLIWTVSPEIPWPPNINYIAVTLDQGNFHWEISDENPIPDLGLYQFEIGSNGLYWNINEFPIPESVLYLFIYNCPNVSGEITNDFVHPLLEFLDFEGTPVKFHLNKSYGLSENIQEITLIDIDLHVTDGFETCPSLSWVYISNSLTQEQVDTILRTLYEQMPHRTVSGGNIWLAGTSAAPSGVYQAACPPTTGKEYAYQLINDTCNTSPNHWGTVYTN